MFIDLFKCDVCYYDGVLCLHEWFLVCTFSIVVYTSACGKACNELINDSSCASSFTPALLWWLKVQNRF